jgi:hypothetical protein
MVKPLQHLHIILLAYPVTPPVSQFMIWCTVGVSYGLVLLIIVRISSRRIRMEKIRREYLTTNDFSLYFGKFKFTSFMYEITFSTSQMTNSVSLIKTYHLNLFREITGACSEIRHTTKYILWQDSWYFSR